MSDLLLQIVANTRLEVEARKQQRQISVVMAEAKARSPSLDFAASLRAPGIRIIAECKQRSPSKGQIAENYDASSLAEKYERGGAAAISVLTDQKYFGGELADLIAVRKKTSLPILRKDFIVDAYQIYEARAAGADSFLLLSGVLDVNQLAEFLAIGRSLGMEPLVESHTEDQLEGTLRAGAKIVGVNNRNLSTFAVDLRHAAELINKIRAWDPHLVPVCESGIKSSSDIEKLACVGYNCFLIGETLVRDRDPEAQLRHFLSSSG